MKIISKKVVHEVSEYVVLFGTIVVPESDKTIKDWNKIEGASLFRLHRNSADGPYTHVRHALLSDISDKVKSLIVEEINKSKREEPDISDLLQIAGDLFVIQGTQLQISAKLQKK